MIFEKIVELRKQYDVSFAVKESLLTFINEAERQIIEAFFEKNVWKIGI